MAAESTPVLAGQWAVFVQPDGPGTLPVYLGCHDMGDIEQELGDKTLIYCPDPERANRWSVVGSFRGEPGPATFEIGTNVRKSKEVLATVAKKGCGVPLYLIEVGCGKRNVFVNWDSQVHAFIPTDITSKGLTAVGKKNPGDQGESMRTFGMSADDWLEFFRPTLGRQSIAETQAIRDIVFCNDAKCADDCGAAADVCEDGALVTEAVAASPGGTADVWFKTGGGAWTIGAADPFGTGEDIASIVCVQVDANTTRYIVARGTTDAGNPAEIAYTDNGGAAWTLVNVGSTNGQFALGPDSLFALDFNHIWLVVQDGYIYFSGNGGVTWEAQQSGGVTAQDLWAINGINESVLYAAGGADVVLKTLDGGATWTLATANGSGDDNLTIDVIDRDVVWVGTDGGDLWRTSDGGETWTAYAFAGSGAGSVVDIDFKNELNGFMLHNSAAPVGTLFRTVNGGYNWETVSGGGTNAGLNALFVCDEDSAFVGGEVQGGTAYVGKASA